MRHPIILAVVGLVAAVACGLGLGLGAGALAAPKAPRPDTIVQVTGNARNGFSIKHYDGSREFPPTWSEAMAECGEYDTRVARVRCRTEVRTWYRDLADLRQALRWAHAQ